MAAVAALACALGPDAALAEWPDHPVTIVVPYAAGGNTDIMARLVSERLTQKLGQAFIVENRPGAGGALATQYVARANPDGYTLLFGTTAQMSILPYSQKINYDPLKDFAPIGIFGEAFSILGISAAVPASDLKSFIDYAKKNPGKINYASGGVGTVGHLVGASFALRAGIDAVHVPYKGGAQSMADLISGQVQMYFGNSSELLPYSGSDKIKLIAVATQTRIAQLPDVPSITEVFPGFSLPAWNGLLAPSGTPAAVVNRLSEETYNAAQDAGISKRLRDLGIDPGRAKSGELGAIIRAEQDTFQTAVKAAGITKD